MQISDLLARVDAGGTPGAHDITTALRPIYDGDEPVVAYFRMACDGTDIRAMGAAKALHEAVLPGWEYGYNGSIAWVKWPGSRSSYVHDAMNGYTSRAWLLAILRALYAQETE